MDLDRTFRRRSNPCESCRRNRRKCVPNSHDNDGPCFHCERKKLQCVYDLSKEKENPEELDEDDDVVEERAQMIEDVAELQRQLASFEKEVVVLRAVPDFPASELDGVEIDVPGSPWSSDSTISQLTTDGELSSSTMDAGMSTPATAFSDEASSVTTVSHPTKRRTPNMDYRPDLEMFRRLNWKITIRSGGIRIHTDIRTFQDLMDFALHNTDRMHPDDPENPLSPAYLLRHRGTGNQPSVYVAKIDLVVSRASVVIIKDAIGKKATEVTLHTRFVQSGVDHSLVRQLFDGYFECMNTVYGIFYRPTFCKFFYDLHNPTSSVVANAICSIMSSRQCEHVSEVFRVMRINAEEQRKVSDHFAAKARELLSDVFDEPRFGTLVAMGFMVQYMLFSLNISRVWMYTTAALRIAEELRPLYLPEPGAEDLDLQAEREMFKRLFYFLSVTSIQFQFLQDHSSLHITESPCFDVRVMGLPKPLPGEEGLVARAVYSFAYLLELGNHTITNAYIDIQYLFAKFTDKLSIESCSRIETSLIRWYNNLPATYRVTPNIFQYMSPEELARADPYSLNLAISFYVCWLGVHAHFIPSLEPNGSDALAAESEAAKLSLRSLTICIKSANIVTVIAEHMSTRWFCRFDPHKMLHACDVHLRLSRSQDIRLAAMGKRNLRKSVEILKALIWRSGGKVPGNSAHMSRYYTNLAGSLETSLAKFGVPF